MVREKRYKRRNGDEKRGLRLLIPVKVVLLAGTAYVVSLIVGAALVRLFNVNVDTPLWGMPVGSWILSVHFAVVAIAVLVSSYFLLNQPLKKIRSMMAEAGEGNFLVRADVDTNDEVGTLAKSFNQMLSKVTELHANQLETEYDLLIAKEELKFQEELEDKNRMIQEANRNLGVLVKDLSLLYEIGQGVNSTIELEELYRVIRDLIEKRLKLREFAILVVDESRQFLSIKTAFGFPNNELIYNMTFRMGEGISGEVARDGRMVYVKDTRKDGRFLHYRGEQKEDGSFLSIPLIFKKDVLGVINFGRSGVMSFSKDEIRLFILVANQIAMAIENAKLYTMTRELSIRDELTRLYNSRFFQQALKMEWKRAIRFKRPLSMLMIDVDFFKNYNDTFGHPQGNVVLRRLADLMQKNLREVDIVARFGGEEFVVLLTDTDRNGAIAVGEKLRRLVEREQFVDSSTQVATPMTISVGISSYPDDVSEMDDLIDHADVALYKAKDGGRNCVISHPQTNIPSDKTTITDFKKPFLVS